MKRYVLPLLVCFLMSVFSLNAATLPETGFREQKTFNDGWRFYKGDVARAEEPSFDDREWETISIPHTWNTDAYTHKDYYKGKGWYRKTFSLPQSWEGKQIFLKFEAASKAAQVYINGQLVGEHRGGYTAFTFDATPYCSFTSPNIIAVCVDNARIDIPPISGDFTFFGGIYRDVWLIATGKQHINLTNLGSSGVFIQTPQVSEKEASLTIRGEIKNDAPVKTQVELEHTIITPDGDIQQKIKRTIRLNAGELYAFNDIAKTIANPHLWSPESPELYTVETVIRDSKSKEIKDKVSHHTGFRWYHFDASEGFFLNGKPYKLRGMCRHQDQKPYGVALLDETHRRDMLLMKDMGINFLRISHYPQDAAILEQCDKLGILAWEEIPVIDVVPDTEGYDDACEQNLREMIRQHYNHPSVITWGYMNEILLVTQRRYKTEEELKPVIDRTLALTNRLEKALKEEDPYRVSTMAFHGSNSYNTVGLGEITDIVGWNLYQGWYGGTFTGFDRFLEDQHKKYPTHPMIVSEYGAGSDRRLHSLAPKSFDFSIEYQQAYLEHYIPVIEREKYIMGGTHWNFIDFSSALRDESMPRINNKGLVYANRTPKDVFYYYKSVFREDIPVLHVASRDWDNRAGVQDGNNPVVQPVKIYTNLPEVELFVNGTSLGKKKSENYTVIYSVPFSTGEHTLRAVALSKDGEQLEDAVRVRFLAIPSQFDKNTINGVELAINVGSNCFFAGEENNLVWLPDRPYTLGSWGYLPIENEKENNTLGSTQTQIINTTDGPLFQTMLVNPNGYRFDVPNGIYEVELLFSDIFRPTEKLAYQLSGEKDDITVQENVFHININGVRVEEAFSPGKDIGYFHAVRKRFVVEASGDGVRICLERVGGKSFLSGIKLRKLI